MRTRLALKLASVGFLTTVLRYLEADLWGGVLLVQQTGSVQASSSPQHEFGLGVWDSEEVNMHSNMEIGGWFGNS